MKKMEGISGDQSVDATKSRWQLFKEWLKRWEVEVFFMGVFSFFFYGSWVITEGKITFIGTFLAVFLTMVIFRSHLHD